MSHVLAGRPVLRMNGAGNEILVLDLRGAGFAVSPLEARAIARQPGLAYDQLMVLGDPQDARADASLKIYNVDGSLSAACGNGTRCVAWALARAGGGEALVFETDAGQVASWREGELSFRVDMGRPRLSWRELPLAKDVGDLANVALDPPVSGAPERFSAVSMGNPHAIFFVADAAAVDLARLGPLIERHPLFPERVNVSFAELRARDDILLRVWERGAGATKACGSAACATLVAAARSGLGERRARVHLPGGVLTIDWRDDDHVHMTGPVALELETLLAPETFEGLAA
jgi:diaminopimelate epimerase